MKHLKILNKRYIALFCVFMALGIFIANLIGLHKNFWIFAGCGAIALCFFIAVFKRQTWVVIVSSAVVIGGILFSVNLCDYTENFNLYEEYKITAKVCEQPKETDYGYRYTLCDVKVYDYVGVVDYPKKIILNSETGGIEYGDVISFKGYMNIPKRQNIPLGMDKKIYYSSMGIGFSVSADDIVKEGHRSDFYGIFVAARNALEGNIDAVFSPETAPIAKAMLIGVKDDIDEDIRSGFSFAGIAHILAVSGLHLGFLVGIFEFILRKFKVNKKINFGILTATIVFYMLITGMPVSVVRAGIMYICAMFSHNFLGGKDTLSFLCLAAVIMLIASPCQLFMAGFLLSFCSVLGILAVVPFLREEDSRTKNKFFSGIKQTFCISASTAAATMPAGCNIFNTFSYISPITNIIAVPAASLILLTTGISALAAFVSKTVGSVIAFIPQKIIEFLIYVNSKIAQSGFGYVKVYGIGISAGIGMIACIFVCSAYFMISKKAKVVFCCAVAAICVLCTVNFDDGSRTKFVFLDLGSGETVHIKNGEEDILITDLDEFSMFDLQNYIEKNNVELDYVFVTKTDKNTRNTLNNLISETNAPKEIYMAKTDASQKKTALAGSEKVKFFEKYDKIHIGNITAECFCSDDGKLSLGIERDNINLLFVSSHKCKDYGKLKMF